MAAGAQGGITEQPDRRALGRPLVDEISRGRLIDRLAERWNTRVVVIAAPGGFGKSIAIAQAVRDNDEDPSGIDVYARCRSSQISAAAVAAELVEGLNGAILSGSSTDELVGEVAAAVADASPQDVCLCLDDVHLAGRIDAMDQFIAGLLEALPFNGHLLLAGRTIPRLRLSKLRAADDVIELGESDLLFDRTEVAELAEHHGIEPGRLDRAGGWPAVTRLSVASQGGSSADFMIEEIVDGLSEDQRRGLGVVLIAGTASDALLDACGVSTTTGDLVRHIPLLVDYGDGVIGAHDLWHEVADQLVDDANLADVATIIVDHAAAAGDELGAIRVALRHRLWQPALDRIMEVFKSSDANAHIDLIDDWIEQLPSETADTPEVRFLEGLRLRFAGDVQAASVALRDAATRFEAAGDLEGETTTVVELGMCSWLSNDSAIWRDVIERSQRIISSGGERMAAHAQGGVVASADLSGNFERALAVHEKTESWDELQLRHMTTLSTLLGDEARALGHAERMVTDFPKPLTFGQRASTYWQFGKPDLMLSARERITGLLGNNRNEMLSAFYEAMVEANLGIVPNAEAVESLAWGRSREQTFVALAHLAHDVFERSEQSAAADFERRLGVIGHDDALLRGELRRFLPYAYICSASAREWLGADAAELGPLHVRLLALTRRFMAARDAPGTPIGDLPTNEEIMTWLPLPWSTELAALLAAAGDSRGLSLAEYLSDTAGAPSHIALRRLADADGPVADGAAGILSAVPAPPHESVRLTVCDRVTVSDSGRSEAVSRLRVRQLLQLLALRTDWTRASLAAELWPDVDGEKARGNLRAALLQTRRLLAPGRRGGEAPFHLRQRHDRIWLHRSDWLEVDAWSIVRSLDESEDRLRSGDIEAAIELRGAAASLWTVDAFADVRDLESAHTDVELLEQRVLQSGAWAAERLLAQGEATEAVIAADQLLSLDPLFERAHDVVIGGHLATGDLPAADRAIGALSRSLDELGVATSTGSEMLIRRFERRAGRGPSTRRRAG